MLLLLLMLTASLYAHADHITGGEIYYTYTSLGNNLYRYHITIKMFMDCRSNRRFENPASISIFTRQSHALVRRQRENLDGSNIIELTNHSPCITNPPDVCYRIGTYEFDTDLAGSPDGYIIVSQVNYRIFSLSNLLPGYRETGATYTAEIPGTAAAPDGPSNNSAKFIGDDLVTVCAEHPMSYSFEAKDEDGDQLRYSFCEAWQTDGGGGGTPIANPPPYDPVPYGNGYTATTPLGNLVTIDPSTGLITGLAPAEGIYVVTVCVEEIRGGQVIATQRKDLQIKITSCSIAAAVLPIGFMACRNTFTLMLKNNSQSPLIRTYNWEIRDKDDNLIFTSTAVQPNYTFPAIGTYMVKLVINRGQLCRDSATTPAYVYPGMFPAFEAADFCVNKPTKFHDRSTTRYGRLISWSWDFADAGSSADQPQTEHAYSTTGTKRVVMTVTNENGCVDTAMRDIHIINKPPIGLAFRDTLICIPDAVQMKASGIGVFQWTPNIRITRSATATPTVNPSTTTKYYVNLASGGCTNTDSVLINVVDHVSLRVMNDTTICKGDTIRLRLQSDGLKYAWSPSGNVLDAGAAFPRVVTHARTTYQVVASIGSCNTRASLDVITVPYPLVNAGPDISICYLARTQLHGNTDGIRFSWSPSVTLDDPNSLHPIANPFGSAVYVLSAYDNKGCPKPSSDTVMVTMMPKLFPFAGHDTSVVVQQPLQFNAMGGVRYEWIPSTGLSSGIIGNPVGIYNLPSPGIRYKLRVYDAINCVDSAYITVKVFETQPSVFVPNAFTPNGDGKNDVFRYIAAGMKHIEFFRVYNRYGQLVYNNPNPSSGWDGTIGGVPQPSGTFVWMLKGIDYRGNTYFTKGAMVLIR